MPWNQGPKARTTNNNLKDVPIQAIISNRPKQHATCNKPLTKTNLPHIRLPNPWTTTIHPNPPPTNLPRLRIPLQNTPGQRHPNNPRLTR